MKTKILILTFSILFIIIAVCLILEPRIVKNYYPYYFIKTNNDSVEVVNKIAELANKEPAIFGSKSYQESALLQEAISERWKNDTLWSSDLGVSIKLALVGRDDLERKIGITLIMAINDRVLKPRKNNWKIDKGDRDSLTNIFSTAFNK